MFLLLMDQIHIKFMILIKFIHFVLMFHMEYMVIYLINVNFIFFIIMYQLSFKFNFYHLILSFLYIFIQ